MTLDLLFLRYDMMVADTEIFRHMALALGISQTSLGHPINMLKHRLDFLLPIWQRNRMLLARAGERFLSKVAKGINHFDWTVQLATSASDRALGAVNVEFIALLNSSDLRELLSRFRRKHDHINVGAMPPAP